MDLTACNSLHPQDSSCDPSIFGAIGGYDLCSLDTVSSEQFWVQAVAYWEDVQSPCSSTPVPFEETATEGSITHFTSSPNIKCMAPQRKRNVYDENMSHSSKVSIKPEPSPSHSPTSTPASSMIASSTSVDMMPERRPSIGQEMCHSDISVHSHDSSCTNDLRRSSNSADSRPPSERRREQNRAAQQRYRMCKEQKIRAALDRVRELESELDWSRRVVSEQEQFILRLKVENALLRSP